MRYTTVLLIADDNRQWYEIQILDPTLNIQRYYTFYKLTKGIH